MAKVTHVGKNTEVSKHFKAGDIVFLRQGEHTTDRFEQRPVIVSQDVKDLDKNFAGTCLLTGIHLSCWNVSLFERIPGKQIIVE